MSSVNVVGAEHRQESRVSTELKAVVQLKDGDDDVAKEIVTVSTISRNGAGFNLSRSCVVGRLVTVVLPMPRELRAYDVDEKLYPVMAIVQYCNEGMVDAEKVFHVGVGFIGKQVPASYKKNPSQNYRITGMSRDGLWEISEAENKFQNRKTPRYWISFAVSISLIRKEEKTIVREETYTKNVGAGGVSVSSKLDAKVGDTVKFACKALDFYAMAVVRNVTCVDGETPTLHLEFRETEFPIERVIRQHAAA